MLRSDLVLKIAEANPHLYRRDVEAVVAAILETMTNALARGDRVELRGFCALSVKRREARTGRNPRTGKEVPVAEKATVRCKTGRDMVQRLNADEKEARLIQLMRENSRPVQDYWFWKDRPVGERGAILDALTVAGHIVSDLRSRPTGEDPPDCEATVDSLACGIEHTELINQKALERSLKGPRQYAIWTPETFRVELQRIISRKDKPWQGGPYARRYLVIVTDEFMLMRDWVTPALQGAAFQAQHLTDVLLGLSYHPSDPPGSEGTTPTFRLVVTSDPTD